MEIGDIVVRKSYGGDITFRIIDIKEKNGEINYILKGMSIRIIADAPLNDLEIRDKENLGEKDEVFNSKVKQTINRILKEKASVEEVFSSLPLKNKDFEKKELYFGRPGKVLHIDGDEDYLEICLKTYKRIGIDAVGEMIVENEQSKFVVDLARKYKPDMVVITGHDSMIKGAKDFMDLNNYRNSKFFVESVTKLRDYEPDYDDLVIFAGACQSCYEAILGAGANFASSPNRVLIHCLDPVFVCEKVCFTNIENVVSMQEIIQNTITGIKGVGGLQTRGKYREGFPKSPYS